MSDKIKYNLKAGEIHPCNTIAVSVIEALPSSYVEHIADQLEKALNDMESPTDEALALGVVVETLRRISKQEKVNDRYVMGASLYLMSTLFNLAMTTSTAYNAAMATQEEETGQDVDADSDE